MIKRIINFQFSIFNFKISGKDIISHPLFSGSAVMVIGTNFGNFFAYIYHLVIGRLLGPAQYGEVAVFISIVGLIGAIFSFLGLSIVKFAASLGGRERFVFFKWLNKWAFIAAIVISSIVLILAPALSRFLYVETTVILMAAPIIFLSLIILVYRSFLHGLTKFDKVVTLVNIELVGRLILGVLAIYLGYSVFGVIFTMFIAGLITFLLARNFVSRYFKKGITGNFKKSRAFMSYSFPILFSSLATSSFFMADVVLVKHYFSAYEAGIYSGISTLGRIIFYGASPIAMVMFPLVSKRHAKGESHRRIFNLSVVLTLAISLGVLLVYKFFPEAAIRFLYGSRFIEGAPFLALFGTFMVLFTLSVLFINYFLSKEKTKVAYLMVLAALAQVFGIIFYHDSLVSVIRVSVIAASFLLVSLIIYSGYEKKIEKKET